MNTRNRVTSEEARGRLADSESRHLGSARDRRIHAAGTATFGLSVGLFTATRNVVSGTSEIVATALYAVALIAVVVWVERAARTVPRRATVRSRVGIGTSFALALLLVLPWLNLEAQAEPNSWPMVVAAIFIVALPSFMAAAVIARGDK